jgi:2-polyprenyl-3-methyl-5-hydroxy-6-metoxy-1,4-benzoquinol methylase
MELIEHLDDANRFQESVFDILSKEGILALSTPNFDIYSDKGTVRVSRFLRPSSSWVLRRGA